MNRMRGRIQYIKQNRCLTVKLKFQQFPQEYQKFVSFFIISVVTVALALAVLGLAFVFFPSGSDSITSLSLLPRPGPLSPSAPAALDIMSVVC